MQLNMSPILHVDVSAAAAAVVKHLLYLANKDILILSTLQPHIF